MNIYEKINAIMAEVDYLQKDDHVKFKTTDYKALSEEKVTSIMHKKFVEHKLMVFPVDQKWVRVGDITHVDVRYRIVNVENPDEFIEVVSCGDGADTQDKGSGKAMTYAFKYMWLRTFAIPTGEDPDKMSNEEIEANQKKVAAAQTAIENAPIGQMKAKALAMRCQKMNVNLEKLMAQYKVAKLEDLTEAQHSKINMQLNKAEEGAA